MNFFVLSENRNNKNDSGTPLLGVPQFYSLSESLCLSDLYLKSSNSSLMIFFLRRAAISGHLFIKMVSLLNILTSHQSIIISSSERRRPIQRRRPKTIRFLTVAVVLSTVKSQSRPIFAPVVISIMSLLTSSVILIIIFITS